MKVSGIALAAGVGAASGLAGAGVMTAVEKLEQAVTGRPSSYVPAHTISRLLGLDHPDRDHLLRNLLMHFGTGMALGALRGAMAAANLRGPWASLSHTHLRLSTDQLLENATGAGAPPWTWPRDELVIDVLHKAVYAFTTGALADALVEPLPRSSARRRAPGLRLKGFA